MRAKEFTTEAALGTTPKRPAREGSRPARGHEPQSRYGISKDAETKFHAKLDTLVHDTFGKRDDEIEEISHPVDIGREWMSDTELDQYVPHHLQQEWRELLGYDRNGNPSALWANLTGGYEPDINDRQHRHLMVKVANKWFAAKKIPNVKFFSVRDADDELEWLVQIGPEGVEEGWFDSKPKVDFKVRAKELFAKGLTEQQVLQQLIKEGCPPNQAAVFVQGAQLESIEVSINEHKKNRIAKKYTKKPVAPVSPSDVHAKAKAKVNPTPAPKPPKPVEQKVSERASRALCTSSTPDEDLGASNLASCKSQGLRARDGDKSHKLGKSAKSRVKVGGHKIKGHKYGGPLPDWS